MNAVKCISVKQGESMRTQTSAVSEYANVTGHIPIWNKVKFIDRDPYLPLLSQKREQIKKITQDNNFPGTCR